MTTSITTSSIDNLALAEEMSKKRADELICRSAEMSISSQEDMEESASIAKSLKSILTKVEGIRKLKVKPLNDQVAVINNRIKVNISNVLEVAIKDIQTKMLEYTKTQERIASEEEAIRKKQESDRRFEEMLIAEDASTDDQSIYSYAINREVTAIAIPDITRSESGAVASIRKTWTFEVTDIVELANTRPDLVEAVSSRINYEIKGEQGNRNIPGLRIYQKEAMNVR